MAALDAPQHRFRLLRHGPSTLIADLGDVLAAKEGGLFCLCSPNGDIDGSRGQGLYFHDMRYLDRATLRLEDRPPAVLLASADRHDRIVCELTNPELRLGDGILPKETLGIRRERRLGRGMVETVAVQNFGSRPCRLRLELEYGADFEDMFVIRGHEPGPRGRRYRPQWESGLLLLRYDGRDGRRRSLALAFDPAPARRHGSAVLYELDLGTGETATIQITATLEDRGPRPLESAPPPIGRHHLAGAARIETDNPLLNRILERSFDDLRMLLTRERGECYFAAGVPWFVALFGRDSLVTALQTLAFDASIAADTLDLLARYQGTRVDPERDEEPGKIPHELRVGELANLGLIPHTPYYGTVDATPLFVALAGEHFRWTGDPNLFRRLRSHVERALEWIDRWGDSDGDGFVDYHCQARMGLVNQGWKDSGNSIVHPDGSQARPPVALVEVQGYVYRAWLEAARLFELEGERERAADLSQRASRLRERFARAYWMPRRRYLALALDATGQVQTVTSNPGQALWSGIVEPEQARAVALALVGPRLCSGWGVRTLAEGERPYNPIDYQVGAVWPHDNSLIVAGLCRYGFYAQAVRIFEGLFEAASRFPNYRLPELFCGFSRARYPVPVRYPVACNPQAWAAASLPFALISLLGLEPDAPSRCLRLRPALPTWLGEIRLRDLVVGPARTSLRLHRTGDGFELTVLDQDGDLEVRIEPAV